MKYLTTFLALIWAAVAYAQQSLPPSGFSYQINVTEMITAQIPVDSPAYGDSLIQDRWIYVQDYTDGGHIQVVTAGQGYSVTLGLKAGDASATIKVSDDFSYTLTVDAAGNLWIEWTLSKWSDTIKGQVNTNFNIKKFFDDKRAAEKRLQDILAYLNNPYWMAYRIAAAYKGQQTGTFTTYQFWIDYEIAWNAAKDTSTYGEAKVVP